MAVDVTALRGDRRASPDRPATFTLTRLGGSDTPVGISAADSAAIEVSGEVRTRGAFRLDPSNCSFPPLRIDVDGVATGTALEGQDDVNLVSSCRPGRPSYDRLVRPEYLVYRTYALLSDVGFRTRWVEITFVDEGGGEPPSTRPGFLIEDDDALAERIGAVVFELEPGTNLPPSGLDPTSMTTTAVFEYMIGNADWSDVAGHNVELFERDGVAVVVPYDFDFSGLVDAPYAVPRRRCAWPPCGSGSIAAGARIPWSRPRCWSASARQSVPCSSCGARMRVSTTTLGGTRSRIWNRSTTTSRRTSGPTGASCVTAAARPGCRNAVSGATVGDGTKATSATFGLSDRYGAAKDLEAIREADPLGPFAEQWGQGFVGAEMFLGILVSDLSR